MARNGLILIKPGSVSSTGTGNSSSIGANGSIAITSCDTISIDNVFSSTFNNYILVMGFSTTGLSYPLFRFRKNLVDDFYTNYEYYSLAADNTSIGGSRANSTAGVLTYATTGSGGRNGVVAYIYSPYLEKRSAVRSAGASSLSGAAVWDYANNHSLPYSYDGITILSGGLAYSGRIAIYGMRK